MKRKIVSSLMIFGMAMTLAAGCGQTTTETTKAEETTEAEETTKAEETSKAEETTETEETLEPEYEEYDSFYQNKNFVWSGTLILDYQSLNPQDYQVQFEDVDGWPTYGIYDSINIYEGNGEMNGYTKPNIAVQLCATSEDGWGVISVDGYTRYIKMEEFEDNNVPLTSKDYNSAKGEYILPERGSTTTTSNEATSTNNGTSSNETTTSKEINNTSSTTNKTPSSASNSTPTNEVETQVVEVSDKYTPEEAVAVWRSILEANGMTWDPSIKEFASWGTGWLELKKGKPEEAAQMDLEGYAYGDGGGHPKTKYYIEVTSYDDNKVYMTSWSCS